ncbi:MAG: undecaprenyl-diphosphatase [Firmicutes bacterium]|nr:undecaprenyl-diphosphatase [Bacillota bacterium]
MNLDWSIFRAINGLTGKNALMDAVVVAFTRYSPVIYVAIFAWLWFRDGSGPQARLNRRVVIYAAFSTALALGINHLIGAFYFRPRPFSAGGVNLLVPPVSDPSFPSDHGAATGAVAGTGLAMNRPLGNALLILAILVWLSRVYVGLHYPSDVLGGGLIGILSSCAVLYARPILEPLVNFILSIWERLFQ